MIEFLTIILSFTGALSFVMPSSHVQQPNCVRHVPSANLELAMDSATSTTNEEKDAMRQEECTWSPQDLTKDCPGYLPIPDDDYVKKYQRNPDNWPVEFFIIAYRRTKVEGTQILVRESANGTSRWGLGTGVPATRWLLSTQERPPLGYQWSETQPPFEASNFPEFPKDGNQKSWSYSKIDIREDAFNGPDNTAFKDAELEEYASKIRSELQAKLSETMNDGGKNLSSWESRRISVVQNVVDNSNSVAAIQGTLRMSGLFERRETCADGPPCPRYVSLGENAPDPTELVQSVRIYTMFPQMPDPMPLPSTPPDVLQKEIASRDFRMVEGGRDPHKDQYGRKFTHKSTSNVSNTIHGIYFTLDVTDLPGLDEIPALDLFGTNKIKREWISLEDLKVLDLEGKRISAEDTKPTFISGFIVRQLVKDGVIKRV